MDAAYYIWNEEQAMKGSCEGGSCVMKLLISKKQKECKNCHLADRYGGQNCNRYVIIARHEAFRESRESEIPTLFCIWAFPEGKRHCSLKYRKQLLRHLHN